MKRQTPRFHDRLTHPLHKPRDWLRQMLMAPYRSRRVAVTEATAVPRAESTRPGAPRPPPTPGTTRVTWIGHATCLIEADGRAILTDPVWSRRLTGGIRRSTEPGMAFEDLPAIDAVVISHNHYDHLDAPTIKRLPLSTLFLVPLGLGRWFHRRGYHNVVEHDWWQASHVGSLLVEFVPAHHWSRRGLFDTNLSLWGGWIVTPPHGGATYFAGDSGYGDCFRQIAQRHSRIDVAILPIGAYSPRWYLQHVHMDPHEAVRAFGDLNAQAMLPMHWGTFRLAHEPILEPLQRAERAWAAAGHAEAMLWKVGIGGSGEMRAPGRAAPGPRPAARLRPAAVRRSSIVPIHRFPAEAHVVGLSR